VGQSEEAHQRTQVTEVKAKEAKAFKEEAKAFENVDFFAKSASQKCKKGQKR
jgi:hypothetical protein